MADDNATVTEKSKYDVKIEEAGPAKKRLTITVPPEVIAEKIEESMGTLATQTAVPGFRKGRAPKNLLERRFGSAVRDETKNQLIADGYSSALEEHSIKPVGEPEPDEGIKDLKIEEGKPLTFSLEVEVVPDFELPNLENLDIKKPMMEIEDEQINAELERQCMQFGEAEPIKGEFQKNDRLVGPGTATKEDEDKPFFTHDNIDIVVPGEEDGGRGQVLGLLIDGLASLIKDKKVGDKIEVETVGPEGHEREDLRGKKLSIEMTIRDAHRIKPASVETVVENFGMGSEEILREQIKLAIEQRRDEEQRNAMRQQVYDHLIESVDFDLPEKLSAAQAARMIDRQRIEMLYRGGVSVEEVEDRLAEMRAETEIQSRNRLKLSFILHKLAEGFEVQVSDQEINGRIAAIAAQRGERPEKLRNELVQSGGIGQIASQLREHKAADRVIDNAKLTEVSADEWNKLVKERAAKRGAKKSGK